MSTIGWLAIILGSILIRQVAKGRVKETPIDLRDMFLGVVSADWKAVEEAAQRTGDSGLSQVDAAETVGTGAAQGARTSAFVTAMMKRGNSAKGYRFGTLPPDFGLGPNWYDCSGLITRALQDVGIYKGTRLTTYTWPLASAKFATQVDTPAVGDVVVWQRGGVKGHMGVVTGPDRFYSALSPGSGIKEAKMSAITGKVSYWRLTT